MKVADSIQSIFRPPSPAKSSIRQEFRFVYSFQFLVSICWPWSNQIITHTPQPLLLIHHQTVSPLLTDNMAPNIEFHLINATCGRRNPPPWMDKTNLQQPIPLSYNGFGNAGRWQTRPRMDSSQCSWWHVSWFRTARWVPTRTLSSLYFLSASPWLILPSQWS